jgi:hypothetical protein
MLDEDHSVSILLDSISSRDILAVSFQRMFTFLGRISLEIRSVFYFCDLLKLSCDDCLALVNEVDGSGTISLLTMWQWYLTFVSGESVFDGEDSPERLVKASISMYGQEILMDEPLAFARFIAVKLEQPSVTVPKCLREELKPHKIKFR